MAIYSRNSSSELPESQIEYRDESSPIRRWITLLIYIVLALVVATLVVFAGRWIYHRFSNNNEPAQTTISTESTKKGASAPAPTPTPTPTTKAPATTSTPTPTPQPSSGKTTTPPPNPGTLPNNGPGEALAVFAVTTMVAGGLHFVISVKRASKPNLRVN